MTLYSIADLRRLNGETSGDNHSRISVGSALLILRNANLIPHKLSATSRYPQGVPRQFNGAPILFAGSRRGMSCADPDQSVYEFPLWTMERLLYIPRWNDISDNTMVATAQAGSNQMGGFPPDWMELWEAGHTVSSTSVKDVR